MGKKLGATQPLEFADYLAKSPIISSFRKSGVTERRVFQDRLVMTASISLRVTEWIEKWLADRRNRFATFGRSPKYPSVKEFLRKTLEKGKNCRKENANI